MSIAQKLHAAFSPQDAVHTSTIFGRTSSTPAHPPDENCFVGVLSTEKDDAEWCERSKNDPPMANARVATEAATIFNAAPPVSQSEFYSQSSTVAA
jgi:hypothetical protein